MKFDFVQVKPTTDASHYTGSDGVLRVPLIVATDCHKGAELPVDQCSAYSWVKMAEPGFAGLVEAKKYPDVRIRLYSDVPRTRPPRLLGLRLLGKKATCGTFFDDTVLGFSDNLTCIIGPRGSGKSAAIDALRYLMGYNRTLHEIPKAAEEIRERQKATLCQTRIEAVYQCSDDAVYVLHEMAGRIRTPS